MESPFASIEGFRMCLVPGCSYGQIHEGGDNQPIVTCHQCGARSCYSCKVPWHEGIKCEDLNQDEATGVDKNEDNNTPKMDCFDNLDDDSSSTADSGVASKHHSTEVQILTSSLEDDLVASISRITTHDSGSSDIPVNSPSKFGTPNETSLPISSTENLSSKRTLECENQETKKSAFQSAQKEVKKVGHGFNSVANRSMLKPLKDRIVR